jgi:hypothetical protein
MVRNQTDFFTLLNPDPTPQLKFSRGVVSIIALGIVNWTLLTSAANNPHYVQSGEVA